MFLIMLKQACNFYDITWGSMLLVLGTRMLLVSGIATKSKKTDDSIVSLSQGNRFKPDPHVQTNPQYHTIDYNIYIIISGWWFQAFVSHNIWDNPSHWLIFFKMVKTTNQIYIYIYMYIYIYNTFYPQHGWLQAIMFHGVNLLMFWWLNPPYFSQPGGHTPGPDVSVVLWNPWTNWHLGRVSRGVP